MLYHYDQRTKLYKLAEVVPTKNLNHSLRLRVSAVNKAD